MPRALGTPLQVPSHPRRRPIPDFGQVLGTMFETMFLSHRPCFWVETMFSQGGWRSRQAGPQPVQRVQRHHLRGESCPCKPEAARAAAESPSLVRFLGPCLRPCFSATDHVFGLRPCFPNGGGASAKPVLSRSKECSRVAKGVGCALASPKPPALPPNLRFWPGFGDHV